MTTVLIISIVVIVIVTILTIVAISKGYAYNHQVDPLPGVDEEGQEIEKSEDK
ncbi:YtzI protein [Alkalibacillus haloalkaliphilus]|uniref:YtzI protein n=1 Tax=Alkalibacillus haloalkaliphilus TaxID=94136 RepID=UPI002936B85B|nr:YtzI protein [Alkalibacillus haloalkaliphilus]MDV2583062.1 YtzI protein [Alkalibacillus haloalkaliphilus]